MRTDEAGPYDLTRAAPQVADDYTAQYVGSAVRSGEDRSPWYGSRQWTYVSDAALADRVRQLDAQREQERAARLAAYRARQAQAGVQ